MTLDFRTRVNLRGKGEPCKALPANGGWKPAIPRREHLIGVDEHIVGFAKLSGLRRHDGFSAEHDVGL